jgi:hypothetical protein
MAHCCGMSGGHLLLRRFRTLPLICALFAVTFVSHGARASAQPGPVQAHTGEAIRISGATTVLFTDRNLLVRARPPRDERCNVGNACDKGGSAAVHIDVSLDGDRIVSGDVSVSSVGVQSTSEQSVAVGDYFIGLRAMSQGFHGEPLFLVVQSDPFADANAKAPVRQLRNQRVVPLDTEVSLIDEQRGNVVQRSGEFLAVLRLEDSGSTLSVEEPVTLKVLGKLLVPDKITSPMRMTTAAGLTIEFRKRQLVLEDHRSDRVPASPLTVRVTFRVLRAPAVPDASGS